MERKEPLGIEIVDVRIKRADFPDSVAPTVFTRMRAERNVIASQFRAEGKREASRIQDEAEGKKTALLAEAQRQVNAIEAERDTTAIDAIIQALGQSGNLSHYRTGLETYMISKGLIGN